MNPASMVFHCPTNRASIAIRVDASGRARAAFAICHRNDPWNRKKANKVLQGKLDGGVSDDIGVWPDGKLGPMLFGPARDFLRQDDFRTDRIDGIKTMTRRLVGFLSLKNARASLVPS
jgi:hypothetical protein